MDPDKKAKAARVLGYFCIVVGALNLAMAIVGTAQARMPLLATGAGALAVGIIMLGS